MPGVAVALRQTAELFRTQRKLWLPFVLVAFLETFFIGLVWLAPHAPFSALLAPPLRYAFGAKALHYPWHLFVVYRAMQPAHLAATALIGAFMTGIACVMVRQTHDHQPLSLRTALISNQVRYGRVTLLWLISWALAEGAANAVARAPLDATWALWLMISISLLLQLVLGYAIPAAVFNGSTWRRALLESVRETWRHPVTTTLVALLPIAMLMAYAAFASPSRVARWMMDTAPEIVLLFVIGRLLIWTVADALLTVGLAHLWWIHRLPASVGQATGIRMAAASKIAGACAVTLALALTGCGVEYQGERLLWNARRLDQATAAAAASATPEQMTTVVAAYERVIRSTPGTSWAAKAQLALGMLHQRQQDYPRATAAYERVLQEYDAYKAVCAEALVASGQIHESEQQWEAAAEAYRHVAARYPWTSAGLGSPLRLAQMAERRQEPDHAADAYARAIDTYLQLIEKAPTPGVASRLKGYLALAYQKRGDWEHAVEVLEELAKPSSGANRPVALMALGTIHETKLHDRHKADVMYTQLIEEFPEHPLGHMAKSRRERLSAPTISGGPVR